MAIVTTDNQHYSDIATAIRSKNGTETLYKPSEMAAAISAISGGGEPEPPDDGKTRLYITVPANSMPDRPPPRNQVPLYFRNYTGDNITVDWGDGTEPEIFTKVTFNTTHTYEKAGDYVISIENGSLELGSDTFRYGLMGSTKDDNTVYRSMLKKIYIGKNVSNITSYAFQYCYSLSFVTISDTVKRIGQYAFNACRSLSSIKIPSSVTTIDTSCFNSCVSLSSVIISEGFAIIPTNCFNDCRSLSSIKIPSSVTTIHNYAFQFCDGMKDYHFTSNTPPVLNSTSIFGDLPSDCIIYVPKGSAEAYKTATNWTAYSQYIQEEPA